MTYASVLAYQKKEVTCFAKITRKRKLLGSDLYNEPSDSTRSISWTYGRVVGVTAKQGDGTAFTQLTSTLTAAASRAACADGNYFYDSSTQTLYVYDTFSSLTTSLATFYVEFESNYCTQEIPFYETPTDSGTSLVRWAGGVSEVPKSRKTVSDNYSGFVPSEISPLVIAHNGSDLFESTYDDSFYLCTATVWICVGPLRTTNCSKIFTGQISGATFTDRAITIGLIENIAILDGVFEGRFYTTSIFSSLDPARDGEPIPLAFGRPRWIKAVNLDYIKEGVTTSDNRVWGVYDGITGGSGTFQLTLSTVTGPVSTEYTCSGLTEAVVRSLAIGDYIRRTSDSTWCKVSAIVSTTSIKIVNVGGASTPANGNTYERPSIQEIYFQVPAKQGYVQNWKIYESTTMSVSTSSSVETLELTAGFEAAATNLGIATIDPDNFEVWVRVSGSRSNQSYGGTYINEPGGHHAVTCLYWYLRNCVGLSESQINGTSFATAAAATTYSTAGEFGKREAYFVHPMWTSDFEDHRTVISRLLQTIGAIGYFDSSGLFTIIARGVLGTADYTLVDNDLIGDPRWEIQQADMKRIGLDIGTINVGVPYSILKTKPATFATGIRLSEGIQTDYQTPVNATARGSMILEGVQLYDLGKDTAASGLYLYRDAIVRMATYFGDRRLICRIRCAGAIADVSPGQVVTLSREYIPGEAWVAGTLATRKFFVLEVNRDGATVELTLEDQYSIEQVGSF